jgi:hypothetical protein
VLLALGGVTRAQLHQAPVTEGVDGLMPGYQNVHLLQMHQQKVLPDRDSTFLGLAMCKFQMTDGEVD